MMTPPSPLGGPLRPTTQADILAGSLRASLALLGPAGVLFGEFLTHFVPNQRLDRLTDYVEILGDRLDDLQAFQTRIESSAAFAAVVEEATVAAVQSPESQRRRDLAEFVKSGLQIEDHDLVAHRALMTLLEQINEPQLVILTAYAFDAGMGDRDHEDFMKKHADVFISPPTGAADGPADERWAMREFYEDQLVKLGLLTEVEGVISHKPRVRKITTLGRMLLKAIARDPRG